MANLGFYSVSVRKCVTGEKTPLANADLVIWVFGPWAFAIEEVKDFLDSLTWRAAKADLEKIGYVITIRVVNARSWGPQWRQRAMIHGYRDDVAQARGMLPSTSLEPPRDWYSRSIAFRNVFEVTFVQGRVVGILCSKDDRFPTIYP